MSGIKAALTGVTTVESQETAQPAIPPTLQLSVGELVAFACRRGDLVGDGPAGPTAQEGIRAHQKLQKQRPAGSEAEHRLEVEWLCEGQTLTLNGRVDILHPQTDLHRPVQLDEIKTTYCPPDKLPESTRQLHWAQLKVYGFCYLLQQRTDAERSAAADDRVALQMLWHNLKEKKTYPELREFDWAELESFSRAAVSEYIQWHRSWQRHRQQVRDSARALPFPFPDYRPGQRELAVAAYRCLRDGGELVVEAPTGIGKTVSTLFPAIKAIGEAQVEQLVYLTAKNSGRQVVRETATRLHEQGLRLSVLEIQARDKTCACRQGLCSRDADGICPRTRGFFDRLPEARRELLGEPLLTPAVVAQVADRLQLCPFELSLQMLPWIDLVVCDFNYVFDPLVHMAALQDQRQRRALLVDEAHNLIDRGRAMHSAALSRSDSRRAAAACKESHPQLRRAILTLVKALDKWIAERRQHDTATRPSRDSETWVTPLSDADDRPTAISRAAQKVMAVVSQLWEQSQSPPEVIADWLSALYRYLTIEQLLAEQHRCLTRAESRSGAWQEQELNLLCLNAADYLQQSYRQFHAVIVFSATLRPAAYVYEQLGLEAQAPYLALPSPFQSEQLGVYLCPYVDTRYQARHRATDALVDMVYRVYQSRPGNYLVFFPSYRFLQQVAQCFVERFPDIALVRQQPGSSDRARAAFLEHFSVGHQSLGFAIMGGVFGEGVDYVGEQLVGTIVVGVGLPQVNEEQELLRQSCDSGGAHSAGNGFDIAYRYPGLTRVLQTAGRVIRTEADRGVVILADYRFADPFYRALYPDHWQLQICNSGEALSTGLSQFWEVEQNT
ncbi:CRISPR-associated exonuclease Cas4 [Microbulbifer donghaiensis]|uniref:CRISPR-associated exonuclease Cas4 n=1 Tax=Microbulbifer donghaiensis TaxID=494016 RepID=A0A1M4URP0_9GAMM|nr:ATP-dependent DNA helicase [Microbulbifer donghaiensis]SHE59411.1 CRISPR-associated exonuclease Cas4 [Microbulbifer donghaiensis]